MCRKVSSPRSDQAMRLASLGASFATGGSPDSIESDQVGSGSERIGLSGVEPVPARSISAERTTMIHKPARCIDHWRTTAEKPATRTDFNPINNTGYPVNQGRINRPRGLEGSRSPGSSARRERG
jgi:hypothetical protein